MTTIDLQPVLQPVLDVAGLLIMGGLAHYGPRAIKAFETYTGIQLSDQQQAKLMAAVNTAAGVIETRIDQQALSVAHVTVANDAVANEAKAIMLALPELAADLGLTEDGVAKMIVAKVDTGSRTTAPAAGS